MKQNKIFTCNNFRGFYPVGTAAVIIAPTAEVARALLEQRLMEIGLEQRLEISQITEVPIDRAHADLLATGDY